MIRTTVAVIGGGISGLSAAYELQSRGVPFTLIEAAARCGGVIRTDAIDGYIVDAGPDALLVQKPAAIDLCRELGLADRLRPQISRATFVLRHGSLRELPEASILGVPTRWGPFVTTRAFSWLGKLRMAAEIAVPRGAAPPDESIASFIGRRFGLEAVEYLAEPLMAGIHGGDPTRLSMRSAFPLFLDLEAKHGSVIAGLRKTRRRKQPVSGPAPTPFVALPGGMGELTDALMARLPAAALHTGVGVETVTRSDGAFVVALADGSQVVAPAVLLATPPAVAARLTATIDPELGALCGRIRSASTVTVALGYRRDAVRHPLNGTGFVVPRREGFRTRALSWVSSKWAHRAPVGRVLLRAYVGGSADPRIVDESHHAVIDTVQREIAPVLDIVGAPDMTRVYRWRDATPQLEVGHVDLMHAIDQRLAGLPGLAISASGFRGTGIADCVADGREQARRLAARVPPISLDQAPPG